MYFCMNIFLINLKEMIIEYIAKEQLKFNFKSSVPSTDNKKINRCPYIFVNGNKENISKLLSDLLDNANKFTVAGTISIVMNVIDIGNNDNKCVIVSIKDLKVLILAIFQNYLKNFLQNHFKVQD